MAAQRLEARGRLVRLIQNGRLKNYIQLLSLKTSENIPRFPWFFHSTGALNGDQQELAAIEIISKNTRIL